MVTVSKENYSNKVAIVNHAREKYLISLPSHSNYFESMSLFLPFFPMAAIMKNDGSA